MIFSFRVAFPLLIACASSEGSVEPAHPRSLARTSAARSYKQWVKRNLQTESQIPGPWMAGHAQLKFIMTECLKTQIRLTGLIWRRDSNLMITPRTMQGLTFAATIAAEKQT